MIYGCDHCGEKFELDMSVEFPFDPPYFCPECDDMFDFIEQVRDEEEDMDYLNFYSAE